jgi:hypothetical protein
VGSTEAAPRASRRVERPHAHRAPHPCGYASDGPSQGRPPGGRGDAGGGGATVDEPNPESDTEPNVFEPPRPATLLTAPLLAPSENGSEADSFPMLPDSLFPPDDADVLPALAAEESLFMTELAAAGNAAEEGVSDFVVPASVFGTEEVEDRGVLLGVPQPDLSLSADIFPTDLATEGDFLPPPVVMDEDPAAGAWSRGDTAPAVTSAPHYPPPSLSLSADIFPTDVAEGSDGGDSFPPPVVVCDDPPGEAFAEEEHASRAGALRVSVEAVHSEGLTAPHPAATSPTAQRSRRPRVPLRVAVRSGSPRLRRGVRVGSGAVAACALLGAFVVAQPDPKAPRRLATVQPKPTVTTEAVSRPAPPPAVPGGNANEPAISDADSTGVEADPAQSPFAAAPPPAAGLSPAPRAPAGGPQSSTMTTLGPRSTPGGSPSGGSDPSPTSPARTATAPAPANDPAPGLSAAPAPQEPDDRRSNRDSATTTVPPTTQPTPPNPEPFSNESPPPIAPTAPPPTTEAPPRPTTTVPPPPTTVPPPPTTTPRSHPCIEVDTRPVPC